MPACAWRLLLALWPEIIKPSFKQVGEFSRRASKILQLLAEISAITYLKAQHTTEGILSLFFEF